MPLAAAATDLNPPTAELAPHWTRIAEGWSSLGVKVALTCVNDVAEHVRATTIDDLKVDGDARDWLASFIDIVGECWRTSGRIELSALDGLMPNQNGDLCSPDGLQRDCGVSEPIKDICTDLGFEIRHDLLAAYVKEASCRLGLHDLQTVLERSITKEAHEDDIVNEAVKRIEDLLPEAEPCEQVPARRRRACVQLLDHLWRTRQTAAFPVARQVPLLASNQSGVRWGPPPSFHGPGVRVARLRPTVRQGLPTGSDPRRHVCRL